MKHKIVCRLYGREANFVTETCVEMDVFLAGSDNPFPCSELISAICMSSGTSFIYRVKTA